MNSIIPEAENARHRPQVNGYRTSSVTLPDGTQEVLHTAICGHCGDCISRVEVRTTPTSVEWPMGDTVLYAGPWTVTPDGGCTR